MNTSTVVSSAVPASSSSDFNDVRYCRVEYTHALPVWLRTEAACLGEDAVKSLVPSVLPTLNPSDKSQQNEDRNDAYKQRAVYFNATGRTREGLIGLAFARDPSVEVGQFKYLLDDANGDGVSIYHCAQQALEGVLTCGRYGVLTDYNTDGRVTISGYDAGSIVNWRVEVSHGVRKLVLLVLREVVSEPDGSYGMKRVEMYRVYRLVNGRVSLELYRVDDGKAPRSVGDISLLRPNANMPHFEEIPFSFIGSRSNSPDIQRAPLLPLADMNLAHFRDSADYQDSVFFCGQVQPWITGLTEAWRDHLEEKGIYIGSRNPILLPTGSQFGFAQAQPNQLAKEAMDSKKDAMVALGARVVEENKVSKTATQAAGDIATGTSVLGLCCANVSEAMTRALRLAGHFQSAKPFEAAKFSLTQDFSTSSLTPADLSSLVEAWQAGAIARSDLRTAFRKSGILSVERTDAQIDQELEGEMKMPIFKPPADDVPPGGAV